MSEENGVGKKRAFRHTAYDNAFRIIEQECDDVLIYFVNQMFSENYDITAKVERLRNEHYFLNSGTENTKRISDSHFRIYDGNLAKSYHLECESSGYDSSILIRLFQYSIGHANLREEVSYDKLVIRIPSTGLLVLRDKGNPPDKVTFEIETPSGNVSYEAPVILMSDYSLDDIFDNKMFFLLPFYFFNLESQLSFYDRNDEGIQEFVRIYCDIIERVRNIDDEHLSLRSKGVIIKQMEVVIKKLAYRKTNIKEKVDDIMGGKVVKMEWLEKYDAAVAEGRAEGKAEGKAEGIAEGIAEGLAERKKLEEENAQLKEEIERLRAVVALA